MGSTPALCNGQYKTILSKFFQIIQNLGIFQIERLKHFLSSEESLFEGSQGRFRSVSIRIDMELDRDEFAIKSFLGIAVSVGQIWEDDRCKKIIVFSFDLDSFWLLLSLVTSRFLREVKRGYLRWYLFVKCYLGWYLVSLAGLTDHRSSDYEFLPIPPILILFPSSAEASFATILVIVVVAEAMQKLLKVITLQCCAHLVDQRCQSMWYTHIWELIQGWLESLVDPIFWLSFVRLLSGTVDQGCHFFMVAFLEFLSDAIKDPWCMYLWWGPFCDTGAGGHACSRTQIYSSMGPAVLPQHTNTILPQSLLAMAWLAVPQRNTDTRSSASSLILLIEVSLHRIIWSVIWDQNVPRCLSRNYYTARALKSVAPYAIIV